MLPDIVGASEAPAHPVRLARQADIARVWEEATPVDKYGARQLGGCLLVPAMRSGTMHNVQSIRQDGSKQFLSKGKTRGCFYLIGKPSGVAFVAVEYKDAVAVHEATGWAGAVAFDEANLAHVARKLWCEYDSVKIIVIADRESEKALQAAAAVGGLVATPDVSPERLRMLLGGA